MMPMLLRSVLMKRIGLWALLQALPSEAALKIYLRSVFMALCSAVIGSILLGALIATGMIVFYQTLITNGMTMWVAASATGGLGVAVLLLFVLLFFHALRQVMVVRENDTVVREKVRQAPASRLVQAVRDGFTSGYKHRL
jgi:hypothetical protein